MKKSLLSLLPVLLILIQAAKSQDFSMKAEHPVAEKITTQQWGLKSRVKKMTLFDKAVYKDTLLTSNIIEYDSKGRILKNERYSFGKLATTYIYNYDDVKKEITRTVVPAEPGKSFKLRHDGKYNVIEKGEVINAGDIRVEKYSYINNNLVSDSFFVFTADRQKTGNYLVYTYTHTYNSIGQLATTRKITGADTTNISYQYKIDKGQVIVTVVTKATYKSKNEFKTETARSVRYYDINGNLLKEDRGNFSGSYFKYEYENDASGNWVMENKGAKKRIIEYY